MFGFGSTGPHSNGYSLIRKIVSDNNLELSKEYDMRDGCINLGKALLNLPEYMCHDKKIKDSVNVKLLLI